MKLRHSEPYAPLRAKAYPELGAQLDAVMKLAQALKEQGFELPPETQAWVDRCMAVKARHPKNRG